MRDVEHGLSRKTAEPIHAALGRGEAGICELRCK